MKVADIMSRDVKVCSYFDSIFDAAKKMKKFDIGSLPVVDGNRLIGIITDRDLVIRGMAEQLPLSTKVEQLMTTDVKTVLKNQGVEEVAELMAEEQIRRVPVVEGETLIGIVSLGDLAVDNQTDEKAKIALSEISEERTEGEQFFN
ncbi:CBS domain-containing protein [Fervidibacillus halotolerans]|uniref:CBS domain-containing protein n=1 Tax=Fervidibacillus halotolerans TaxID=2980027 RepID=A0A9E8RZT6_9BACI|nr:CBS domain-containing protein [Fervidibacillus halotolerans]WAA13713.1 CBS domain-containing protein [Fervidibacillus halotolerans]